MFIYFSEVLTYLHIPAALTYPLCGVGKYDVTDDGSIAAGSLYYGDGHTVPAICTDGSWRPLPLHASSMNTNEAHATLAATDNDYAATSDIVAVSAREFTVSFDPVPASPEDASTGIFILQGTHLPATSPATLPAGHYIINGGKVAVK